jgi:hypothetical protein
VRSWRHAPLYVEAHDLALWLDRHGRDDSQGELAKDLGATGREFLFQVSRALAFPAARAAALEAADGAALRLRVLLRVAAEVGDLSPSQLRFVSGRVERAGRMLGGWRRQRRLRETGTETGVEPP